MFIIFREHEIPFSDDVEQRANILEEKWDSVYFAALFRLTTLETVKENYYQVTEAKVEDFLIESNNLLGDFELNGPQTVGSDLKLGVLKMKVVS